MNPFESDLSLKGRVALVTGAGGGIGSSVCRALLIRGARILGIDRPGIETPAGVEGHDCDLSEVGSLDALFESLTPEFQRIDILVH